MLAGGADLLCCVSLVRSWERLRILCPANSDPTMACRPFDRSRNGLSLGDGGALFVLEEREHARRRGATILAEVAGAFENADGFDMLKPAADGEVLCMQGALDEAGMTAADIDMVQAHGTATQLNDATEFSALRRVLGTRAEEVPVAAIKSMIGHTMGASGALSVAAAIGSLANGYVYPIPGFRTADDDVHINVSATGRLAENVTAVLVNAFGFGGANACLVIAAGDRDD
jgi:3-oxoacyl-(acyl-carrier-protein) synthase